ncbi:hypothetical protein JZM24_01580 [Candidatus Sodalis endolongispinus]|uniref:Uncharacterized protein n=1 Tax=Candidatus Sodalis endolongispinus TaxID=2812662 RepID=A0ABS5Y9F5_9GAMM|nr:hypothetical protein [Candidatus Sodalis endolongispinus]MBT9431175.1 hypothetical protein [Candidatus Sodalis endolongispinus]
MNAYHDWRIMPAKVIICYLHGWRLGAIGAGLALLLSAGLWWRKKRAASSPTREMSDECRAP